MIHWPVRCLRGFPYLTFYLKSAVLIDIISNRNCFSKRAFCSSIVTNGNYRFFSGGKGFIFVPNRRGTTATCLYMIYFIGSITAVHHFKNVGYRLTLWNFSKIKFPLLNLNTVNCSFGGFLCGSMVMATMVILLGKGKTTCGANNSDE